MAFDRNAAAEAAIQGPAQNAIAVTPADSDLDLDGAYTRSVYVGGTGDLTVTMAGERGDTIVTYKAVPAGSLLPIVCKQIRTTLTTATLIVAMW